MQFIQHHLWIYPTLLPAAKLHLEHLNAIDGIITEEA